MISGSTRVFGVVGHPVAHSLSPRVHNALFRAFGLDAVYVPFDAPTEDAGAVVRAACALNLAGWNVTAPLKERIVPLLDRLAPEARAAGAVNVVVRGEDGVLTGHNTDGEGWMRALAEELGAVPRGSDVAVLGAGGTGRAVAAAAAAAGARAVTLYNRTPARAAHAADALAGHFPGTRFTGAALTSDTFAPRASAHGIVVNCTSGPGAPSVAELDVRALPAGATWTDVNYWMPDPPCLQACERSGVRSQRGLGMFVHQAALSFHAFTGRQVDSAAIRRLLGPAGG